MPLGHPSNECITEEEGEETMTRWIVGLAVAAVLGGAAVPVTAVAHGGVSFGLFYSSLTPHGEWIAVDGGIYAWRPARVHPGWRPYLDGRWAWSEAGWYWVSEEPWGWATYHYGRWYDDDYYGWVWIPGYEWAPAWVEWRYGRDYVGWAPLGPYAVFHLSIGIHYSRPWITPYHYWTFVGCRDIVRHDMHRYVYRQEDNARLFGRTRSAGSVGVSGDRVVTRGPERTYIEQRGGVRVQRSDLVDVDTHEGVGVRGGGSQERISVYRPNFDRENADRTERPSRVVPGERSIGLDPRGMDIRRAEEGRVREGSGESIGRESFRGGREADPGRGSTRELPAVRERSARVPDQPSVERRERAPRESYRGAERRPERSAGRSEPRIETRRESPRSAPPSSRGGERRR
jgi:hypothetical protein